MEPEPTTPGLFDKVRESLAERRYGANGGQTLPERFEEALDRFSYALTQPAVVILGWLTGADPRSFGFATAQISGLFVTGLAFLRLTENMGFEALPASIIGVAGFTVSTLLVPAFKQATEPDTHEVSPQMAARRLRVVTSVRSAFSMVALMSYVTGHGPRSGVAAVYLVAVGLTMSSSDRSPSTFQQWLRATIKDDSRRAQDAPVGPDGEILGPLPFAPPLASETPDVATG